MLQELQIKKTFEIRNFHLFIRPLQLEIPNKNRKEVHKKEVVFIKKIRF